MLYLTYVYAPLQKVNYRFNHYVFILWQGLPMVLYGNLELGSHVWVEIGNLICLRHLFRSGAVVNINLIEKHVRNMFKVTIKNYDQEMT